MSVPDRITKQANTALPRLEELLEEWEEFANGDPKKLKGLALLFGAMGELAGINAPQPFLVYRDAFVEALPRVAPEAFAVVLDLAPLAERVIRAPFAPVDDERLRCRSALWDAVRALLVSWGVTAAWLERGIYHTAVTAAYNAAHGLPAPESLCLMFPLLERDIPLPAPEREAAETEFLEWLETGELNFADVRMDVQVTIPVNAGPYRWNPFQESRKEFRKRAIAQFTAALDASFDEFGIEDAPVLGVETQAVEWLILRTIGRQTEYGVNKQYHGRKDSRGTIRRRVREVADILEITIIHMG